MFVSDKIVIRTYLVSFMTHFPLHAIVIGNALSGLNFMLILEQFFVRYATKWLLNVPEKGFLYRMGLLTRNLIFAANTDLLEFMGKRL